jgi:hypothetical protein
MSSLKMNIYGSCPWTRDEHGDKKKGGCHSTGLWTDEENGKGSLSSGKVMSYLSGEKCHFGPCSYVFALSLNLRSPKQIGFYISCNEANNK